MVKRKTSFTPRSGWWVYGIGNRCTSFSGKGIHTTTNLGGYVHLWENGGVYINKLGASVKTETTMLRINEIDLWKTTIQN